MHITLTAKKKKDHAEKGPLTRTPTPPCYILTCFWNTEQKECNGNRWQPIFALAENLFTFNPHTLRGLVGKATCSAICFPRLHLNSPDQPAYPSIFLERIVVRPGRHALCWNVQRYADKQLAASSLHFTSIALKFFLRIDTYSFRSHCLTFYQKPQSDFSILWLHMS